MSLMPPALALGLLCLCCSLLHARGDPAPAINTWLVAGPLENGPENAGYHRDWIGEAQVEPRPGQPAAGSAWRYFDDRLFSRNYDDYQDLFSYFQLKRGESAAAQVAYLHVYVHSARAQAAELRLGADNAHQAWLNGKLVSASPQGAPQRDALKVPVGLEQGWNRLLLKVANQGAGRLGCYARLCDAAGAALPGLTYAVDIKGKLAVATRAMPEAANILPVACREWPYVGARAVDAWEQGVYLRRPELALHASDFFLQAQGGLPPYRWALAAGKLPPGLALHQEGRITGTVAASARLGDYPFTVQVKDTRGAVASAQLTLAVQERPNRWYEAARLVALIHAPESMPQDEFARFARTMKRQGYGVGMVISYNNGDYQYRWPSRFEPDNPLGDLLGKYQAALEAEGIRFGMYIGNLNGPNHGGDDGALLMLEEAVRRYRPAAFWFDWAGWDGVSLDAIYSMIRTLSPETVIVLNGLPTISNGDWDIVVLEGWGAWGKATWDLWPFPVSWPKRHSVETWRMLADPAFDYSKDIYADWQDYLRLQISLIGAGFIANIDHSPTIRMPMQTLTDSHVYSCHQHMADWASPPGLPARHESYTQVDPGPLPEADWGYNTINLARDAIYLHLLANPLGKQGMPQAAELVVKLGQQVREIRWLNGDRPLSFHQRREELAISLEGVAADPIDTIIKISLARPHPAFTRPPGRTSAVPAGNLACQRPACLLNAAGTRPLPASGFRFAHYGVDGLPFTCAQGGDEWAWTYHVDLEAAHLLGRVVVNFGEGYATAYRVLLSADGAAWTPVAEAEGCPGGRQEHAFPATRARYVRVQAVKPDGPDQPGSQMQIRELEVYAAG